MTVETATRGYNFYLDFAADNQDRLELYDLPTTLSSVKKAIEMAIPTSWIGTSLKQRLLKQKEMHNFCQTLTFLINENPITRKHAIIEFVDVNPV